MWTLLHGFTGSPDSWSRVLSHAELIRPVSAPWLLGHGSAWRSRAVGSFGAECARVQEMSADTGWSRLLCGYSLGARVALGVLNLVPNRFDAAVLIGAQPGLDDCDARSERRKLDAQRARTLRQDGLPAFVEAWETLPLFASQRELPDELRREQRQVRLAHDAEGLARSLEVLGLGEMPSYGPSMGALGIPIILVAGSLDAKFTRLAESLAALHANVDVEIIPGAGHNLILEAPLAIARILKRVEERVL
ncbi:MAG: alpha/beta fold hydrolase [Polyangiales bacterium]